jgi:hypothetical protein
VARGDVHYYLPVGATVAREPQASGGHEPRFSLPVLGFSAARLKFRLMRPKAALGFESVEATMASGGTRKSSEPTRAPQVCHWAARRSRQLPRSFRREAQR